MKKIILITILIILAGGVFLFLNFFSGEKVAGAKAYEFTGSIQKVDRQTIYMHGNYNSPDHPEWRADANAVDIKVRVDADTKLVRITIHRPANFAAQIAAGKAVDPGTLKQEVTAGSLADLTGGKVNGATIETSSNIYGDKKFMAQSITYYYAVDEE